MSLISNLLTGAITGLLSAEGDLKDFQHASRLFTDDNYARSPKVGFLYYVSFNINSTVKNKLSEIWKAHSLPVVGLLVKSVDLPKFQIDVQTVNQYNRKKLVQTGIKYQPITISFHDDNSNITTNLWKQYYEYYFADAGLSNTSGNKESFESFQATKYMSKSYRYGLDNNQAEPFFDSVDVYIFYRRRYTKFTIVNPTITDWSHDTLSYSEAGNILANKMTLSYETVVYNTDTNKNRTKYDNPPGFANEYYDKGPSPLGVGAGGAASLFGEGGIIDGAGSVIDAFTGAAEKTPLQLLGASIQAINLAKSASQLSKGGLIQEGYSILGGALKNIQNTGNQQISNGAGVLGVIGNSFSNTSLTDTTKANLKKLTGP